MSVLTDADVSVSWGVALAGAELHSAARLLDDRERHRASAIHNDLTQRRFISAHAMRRIMVAQRLGWDARELVFESRGLHGKPELVYPPLRMYSNIATAGDRIVCAVTDTGPVGVDVESHDVIAEADATDGIDDVLLTPAEREVLLEFPHRDAALTRWWVRKEAVLKATGDGMTLPPPDLEMSAPDEHPQLLRWQGRPVPATWMSDIDVGPGYEAAVAVLV